jgi:hypothetical protein
MIDNTVAWIKRLSCSHDQFTVLLSPLDDEAVAGPSYDDEWSIAQVASHLGSQAEIFARFVLMTGPDVVLAAGPGTEPAGFRLRPSCGSSTGGWTRRTRPRTSLGTQR